MILYNNGKEIRHKWMSQKDLKPQSGWGAYLDSKHKAEIVLEPTKKNEVFWDKYKSQADLQGNDDGSQKKIWNSKKVAKKVEESAVRCKGINESGKQCHNFTTNPSGLCHEHELQQHQVEKISDQLQVKIDAIKAESKKLVETEKVVKTIKPDEPIMIQCQGITVEGSRCKNKTGNSFCPKHEYQQTSKNAYGHHQIELLEDEIGDMFKDLISKKDELENAYIKGLSNDEVDKIHREIDQLQTEITTKQTDAKEMRKNVEQIRQCAGYKENGYRCENMTYNDIGFCHLHLDQVGRSQEDIMKLYDRLEDKELEDAVYDALGNVENMEKLKSMYHLTDSIMQKMVENAKERRARQPNPHNYSETRIKQLWKLFDALDYKSGFVSEEKRAVLLKDYSPEEIDWASALQHDNKYALSNMLYNNRRGFIEETIKKLDTLPKTSYEFDIEQGKIQRKKEKELDQAAKKDPEIQKTLSELDRMQKEGTLLMDPSHVGLWEKIKETETEIIARPVIQAAEVIEGKNGEPDKDVPLPVMAEQLVKMEKSNVVYDLNLQDSALGRGLKSGKITSNISRPTTFKKPILQSTYHKRQQALLAKYAE